MRKGRLVFGLVLSHGLIAWAGYSLFAGRVQSGDDRSAQPSKKARAAPASSLQANNKSSHEERLAAANNKYGPGTDFAAVMSAWSSDPKRKFTPEIEACLSNWLQLDTLQAVKWLHLDEESNGSNSFYSRIVGRYLEAKGESEISRLLNELPDARWVVLGCMRAWMANREASDLLRVAAGVTGQENRKWLLNTGLKDPAKLMEVLPGVRALLDDHSAAEFFSLPPSKWPLAEVAEAARQAGFPQAAVNSLLAQAKKQEKAQRSFAEMLAIENRANATWIEKAGEKLGRQHPEFHQ